MHQVQKIVTIWIRENFPNIKSIEYFSDGFIDQYKNYKNLNLCHHKKDFQLDAILLFFAKRHGKSLCDGIGGTVKSKIMHAKLQKPVRVQILSFDAVEEFFKFSIEGVFFMVIKNNKMVEFWEELEVMYSLGSTVPSTKICHHFQPTSVSSVKGKHLSIDTVYPVKHSFP